MLIGAMYKKRGGLGRHAANPWQRRAFTLSHDGVLAYHESENPSYIPNPKQCVLRFVWFAPLSLSPSNACQSI